MIDLAVAYRIYPGVSGTPAAWGNDKLRLSEICLSSFSRALGSLQIKLWALLDGCPTEYERMFCRYFDEDQLVILNLNQVGNQATFAMQVKILTEQKDADLVYFAEDDYLYLPNCIEEMVQFARANHRVDFVSPYDHSGNYNSPLHRERHLIKAFGSRHWRTSTATCLTFLAKRASLLSTRAIFLTYQNGNDDGSIWMAITQKAGLLNLNVYAASPLLRKLWLKAAFWGFFQILFSKRRILWSPIPSAATHLESRYIAPAVDWAAEFRSAEAEVLLSQGRDKAVNHRDSKPHDE